MSVPIKERSKYTKSCPGWAITKDWVINQLNNIMSDYHCTSDLERANEKIYSKFDGDSKDGQKKMAGKLDDFIKNSEGLKGELLKAKEEVTKLDVEIAELKKIPQMTREIEHELKKLRELSHAVQTMLNFKV